MTYPAYKNVEIEESTSKQPTCVKLSQPFVVPGGQPFPGDRVTRRVVQVVDFELAQGSMPA